MTAGEDKVWIQDLCRRHTTAIEMAHMQSINTCILVFKVLNRFPVRELWMEHLNSLDMDNVPAWLKIQTAFAN